VLLHTAYLSRHCSPVVDVYRVLKQASTVYTHSCTGRYGECILRQDINMTVGSDELLAKPCETSVGGTASQTIGGKSMQPRQLNRRLAGVLVERHQGAC